MAAAAHHEPTMNLNIGSGSVMGRRVVDRRGAEEHTAPTA